MCAKDILLLGFSTKVKKPVSFAKHIILYRQRKGDTFMILHPQKDFSFFPYNFAGEYMFTWVKYYTHL